MKNRRTKSNNLRKIHE